MKKSSLFLLSAVVGTMFGSCITDSSNDPYDRIEMIAAQPEKGGNWCLMKPSGEFVYEDEFENCPSVVIDGIFTVNEGDTYAVMKVGSLKHPETIADELTGVGYYYDGLIPICRANSRIEVIDAKGETKFTMLPVGGNEVVRCAQSFSDGMIWFQTDEDKFGFMNTDGEVVIEPVYDGVGNFGEGLAVAMKMIADKEVCYIINKDGEELARFKKELYTHNYTFHDGKISVRLGDDDHQQWGFINTKGEFTKAPSKVDNIWEYVGDVYVYQNADSKFGIIKGDEIVLRAKKYSYMQMLHGDTNRYLVEKDDVRSVIDIKGEEIFSLEDYKTVYTTEARDFWFFARESYDDPYFLLDKNGKPIKGIEMADYNVYLSVGGNVNSAYFDAEGMAAVVAGCFNGDEVCGVAIGAHPSKYLYDAEEYAWDTYFPLDMPQTPETWRLTGGANTTCSIAQYYYSGYDFVPESEIYCVILVAHINNEQYDWAAVKSALIDAFERRGFTLDRKAADRVEMHYGNYQLEITHDEDDDIIFRYSERD